ncbi:hypothetical protein HGB13_04255, partial [bacterium]|nr:hypothetical protein [bacterium]
MNMQLSKSEYIMFLKQPAWLWLKKNDPKKLPPVDDATQAIFDAGFLFESYAEKLFPDGIKLNWEGYKEYKDLPKRTNEAIFSGAKTIFQPRFETNDITCICDVVVFVGKNTVDLYEIKSSAGPKPYHEHDLAFQAIVLEDSGFKVRNMAVIHVNKNYIRHGEVDAKQITDISDLTEKVKKRLKSTRLNINKALDVMKQKEMPNPSPSLCQLNSIFEWLDIYKSLKNIEPGDGSIYDLYNPSAALIGKLEEKKIDKIMDIPVNFNGLSEKQNWQLRAYKERKIYINRGKINDFLDKLKY